MPSPSAAPSVRLEQTTPPMVVTFDFGTLERIEEQTGKTINELVLEDLEPFMPTGEKPETPEAKAKMAKANIARFKRQRFSFVVGFVAACLRSSREELSSIVKPEKLLVVLGALCGPFIEAVQQINGMSDDEEEAEANPQMPSAIEPSSESTTQGSGG